jgi:hypothetical protein
MIERNGHPVAGGLARFWTAGSAMLLLVIAVGILLYSAFWSLVVASELPSRTTGR